MNDARMNMDTILTSTISDYKPNFPGANVLNYTKFIGFKKDEKGTIIGAEILDKTTNQTYVVKTKAIVNCAGVFADEIRKLDNPNVPNRIVTAQGSHIILPPKFGNKKTALLVSPTSDGRLLFVLPWLDNILVGTTDINCKNPVIDPIVRQNEMDFMIRELTK